MLWLALLKPGDWLIVALGVAVCALAFPLAWQAGVAEKAIVRRGGDVFSELDLSRNRRIDVPGPLGITTVVVDKGRVRVAADPGPPDSTASARAGCRGPARSPSVRPTRSA